MKLATTPDIAGHHISETLGLVRGSTVRTKHVGTDIIASLKNLVGGEVRGYSSLMAGAREQAVDRMVAQAREMGADAIVGLRMETSSIAKGASELLAYGTAVKLTNTN
ncbi:hypothetical protein ROA7450_00505 [Roseovarius albus]|uniref:UPF0145 protein ROA7450_00505 n=1 Tax=Roseovarius albus TaxID=1247867 RepID=A0A1X6YCZ2_9RHOB|nr:YbjQ family protein [Roseovarius albus]SLN17016.1 hypothetical protein ROA7450_00505 [Roseovarius albus]